MSANIESSSGGIFIENCELSQQTCWEAGL